MGDLQLIGQGRQAEVFAWGDTKVLKLFAPEYDVAIIEAEARASQAVHEFGVPTPGTHGVVEVEGRHGITYDRVSGTSMVGQLSAKPWKLFAFGRMLAELHASIHEFRVDQLPSQHEQLEHLIARAELPAARRNTALARLRKLPEGAWVCHGDFHPDNVLVNGATATIIDWTTACAGNPVADFARTSLIIQLGAPPPSFSLWTRIMMHIGRGLFHGSYTRQYRRMRRLNPGTSNRGYFRSRCRVWARTSRKNAINCSRSLKSWRSRGRFPISRRCDYQRAVWQQIMTA